MADRVYGGVVRAARAAFRLWDLHFDVEGTHHIPASGPAVLASNHISFLDFLFCGLAAQQAGRLVRFMAMQKVFDHPVSRPLMRGMGHIPVDRDAGAGSYRHALRLLTRGEVVGIFPEGRISPSLDVKEFRPGAAAAALESGAPLIPMAVWGGQNLWHPDRRRTLNRRHVRIGIRVGPAVRIGERDGIGDVTDRLHLQIRALRSSAAGDEDDEAVGRAAADADAPETARVPPAQDAGA